MQIKLFEEEQKKKTALNPTTLSFKYLIENVSIKEGFHFWEFPSFQVDMVKLIQQQANSDNLFIWFHEDYFDYLKAADFALALRKSLMQ